VFLVEDLSTILTAVKSRQRTEQFVVLAALYALGAFRKPVTAADVTAALKLNLSSKSPSNVSARLRQSAKYVSIVSKGPPLRWALKEEGIRRLRELSGLPLSSQNNSADHIADVGIVCALEHPEFSAVTDAIGGAANWRSASDPRFPHVYQECALTTAKRNSLRVVATTATSMGLTAAAIVTTQLIMQFRPRIVVMIGIAAGTRDGGKEFGDVLVADPSVDYNSGKVVRANGIRGFLPDPYPIGLNSRLRSVLHKYRGPHPVFDQIRAEWDGKLPSQPNRLHLGPLGAADQVIDDETLVLEIQRNWRKLIGVEMETYGVYRACHESPDPKPRCVSFKSVCDFAAAKSDSWQEYAAFVAAQFAVRFLTTEWETLWPLS
jgi:nucleoside phosphorylase